MINLENELLDMVMIFDYYQIPEERQRYIITSGVLFEFSRNERVRLSCFRFAKLLKLCKNIYKDFDANQMLKDLNQRQDNKYESLVKLYLDMENKEKDNQKQLTR